MLNEPVITPSTLLAAGQLVVLDGTHAVVVNPTTQTAAALSASLPGTPAIRQIDIASRRGGVFLDAGGATGKDIFET
jgi:hypothetical protein